MKKFYPLMMVAMAATSAMQSYAQCVITAPIVQYNYSTPAGTSPDSCDINFDLRFSYSSNNGNKRLFIHLWTQATYPVISYAAFPTASQLVNSLGTIHIEDPGATATLSPVYVCSVPGCNNVVPGVKVLYNGLTLVVNTAPDPDQYTVKNITVRVPGACGPAVNIVGDIWGVQNNGNGAPTCTTTGFSFVANNPIGVLEINCFTPSIPNDPQTYDLKLTTTTVTPFNVSYNIYIDNGDNVFDAGTDIPVGATNGPYSLSQATPLNFIDLPYLYQSNPNFNTLRNRTVWAVIQATGIPNLVLSKAPNGCAILPVKLASFTAVRKGKEVYLEWKTAQEVNNAGFTLERLNGNGTTETIAKVASQAANGFSNASLTYHFEHLNLSSANSQYRLKQTGRDGAVEYSEIRLVNGIDGFKGVYVFPNPASGGILRIFFDDPTVEKQISLIDNTGRTIRQLSSKNVTQTQLTVPVPGIYHLSTFMPGTGQRIVQKVVVNN